MTILGSEGSPPRMLRLMVLASLLIALAGWSAVGGREAAAQAPIETTILAAQEIPAVPAGRRWVVRANHPLDGVPHIHAGGFVYVQAGSSRLQIDGDESRLLHEGGAGWVPEGVPHTHTTAEPAQLWSFLLETAVELQAAPPLFATPEIANYREGPHLARIKAETFAPGGATPPHRHFGPEAVYLRDGAWEFSYAGLLTPYSGGSGYLAEPLVPHQLRNVGAEPGRLFNLSLVPLGQPDGEALPPESLR